MINVDVWAQLYLCDKDRLRIRDFFTSRFKIKSRHVIKKMHISVYYSRRPMPGLKPITESVSVTLPSAETRFMVMAPGGENPRPELLASEKLVGFRVHKKSSALPVIFLYRERLLEFETEEVLGRRAPSTYKTSAFGARYYQPHMAILEPGSGVNQDLSVIGVPFREEMGDLTFDRFEIKIVQREGERPKWNPN